MTSKANRPHAVKVRTLRARLLWPRLALPPSLHPSLASPHILLLAALLLSGAAGYLLGASRAPAAVASVISPRPPVGAIGAAPRAVVTVPPGPVDPVTGIYIWAGRYGLSGDALAAVARCESQFDPAAVGDGGASVGIFQFRESSFEFLRQLHNSQPLSVAGDFEEVRDWTNPLAQAHMAAFGFANGYAGWWSCRWAGGW